MNDVARQKRIVDEARMFADAEIRPRAREFDENEALPRDFISKMVQRRFHVASLPEEYGGLGLDPVYYGLFTEEIGKACCCTRALVTVQSSLVGETLLRCGSKEQKDKWLPAVASGDKIGAFALSEPEVGTDARGVQTVYERVGNDYIISGRKKWISFGEIADFVIVIATLKGELTAFIVDRERKGVKTMPMKGLLASRASHVAEIELNGVCIPEKNVIGKVGSGFTYVAGTALDHGRYSIAWAGVAVAQEALEAMLAYSLKRTQFGKKIWEFQLIRGMIGDAVTKTHAARALCLRAGKMRKEANSNAIPETTIAKYFASKVAMEVATDAVQVHGGNGCSNSYPVERLFREAKVLEIIEGTSQIQQLTIAKYGLRKYHKR